MTYRHGSFVEQLMTEVLHLHRLPKVQVERVVGPILGLFLERVVGHLLRNVRGCKGSRGGYRLVSPEFPLKRMHNSQSTNIDWLLVHPRRRTVVLFELKTAPDSVDSDQLATYLEVQKRIRDGGGGFLLDDLETIRDASSRWVKYDQLLGECEARRDHLRRAKRVVVLYLMPASCNLKGHRRSIVERHFADLPRSVDGPLAAEWKVIREALLGLEDRHATERDVAGVEKCLGQAVEKRTPVRFWVGTKGKSGKPNYQVEFQDGKVVTYHHDGATFGPGRFNPDNLRGPYAWNRA